MNRTLTVLAALVILTGCATESEPDQAPEPSAKPSASSPSAPTASTPAPEETRPGDPVVYEKIAASTDCVELQHIFDTAANGPARPWKVAYMNAADTRMREVGCY
jgi:PBP1b-binding outer membrane lipoprotein LpoB